MKVVKFWTIVLRLPTEVWKLVTSETKLSADVEILLIYVLTVLMVE